MGKFKEDVIRRNGQVESPMDCSGAKRAPMVETKRNPIRLALSSAYSFGVALPMRLRIRIPRLNPATCVA